MTFLDYAIVLSFLAALALAGFGISKLIKTSDDLFVAGRELTPFILCATITSTNLSMFHFVGMGGIAYQHGISMIWQNWTGDMALVLSGILVIPLMRRLRIRSVPEFLEMRYSRGMRMLIGAFWGIRLCVYLGIILYIAASAAIIITGCAATKLNYVYWLLAFSLVSIMYSAIGGAWAVAIMDSVQFLIMLGGALIVLPVAAKAVGGFPALFDYLRASGQGDHLALVPAKGEFNWLWITSIMLLGFKFSTVDQAILQRAFGARSPRIGAKGMVLSAIVTTPFAFFWILPGLAVARLRPGFTNPDHAIPWLLSHELPAVGRGLLGIVLCGLLAAQISVITADVNSVATLFTSDVYRNFRRREPSQRELLLVVRLSSLVCGVLMLIVALVLYGSGSGAVKANLSVVGILDMALFAVAIVYGLLWKRANWQGAIAGFIAGGCAAITTRLVLSDQPALARNLVPIISLFTALIVTPIVSLLTPAQPESDLWRSLKVSGHDEGADPFYLMPRSGVGRIGMGLVLLGFILFFIGVFGAPSGLSIAGIVAVAGMLSVFAGGLMRVYSA